MPPSPAPTREKSQKCLLLLFPMLHLTAPRAQILVFCARTARKQGFQTQKRTKTSILCSNRPKMGVPKGKSAQKCRFCARTDRKQGFQTPKAHKDLDFVLEMPKNRGSGGQKRTKMPILCLKCQKTGVPEGKNTQKPRFCAREDGKVASGRVKVAFLQITAHVSKTQMPHNQIINF